MYIDIVLKVLYCSLHCVNLPCCCYDVLGFRLEADRQGPEIPKNTGETRALRKSVVVMGSSSARASVRESIDHWLGPWLQICSMHETTDGCTFLKASMASICSIQRVRHTSFTFDFVHDGWVSSIASSRALWRFGCAEEKSKTFPNVPIMLWTPGWSKNIIKLLIQKFA